MEILLALLVFLLPLLITPGILFHYDVTPKVIILCLAMAGCTAFPRQIAEGAASLWRRKAGRLLFGLAAAQTLWYAVAAALSTRPWFSVLGSNWRRMGLATVVALCAFAILAAGQVARRAESLSTLLRAYTLAMAIASLYGILQYFDIDPLQTASAYHAQAGDSTIVRPPGTLGHADYFGWWLAIGMFCALALARIERGGWRWVAFLSSVLSGIAIVLSGTRSALLAVALGFVSLAVFAGFRPRKQHRIAGVAAVGIFVVFYISPAGTRLRARVRWSSDEPIGGARPLLWRDSLQMAAARPLAGFGPETFSAEFPRFQSVELARLLPDFYHESPHNTALDALTSEGIPGLAITLGWIFLGGWAALRARQGAGPYLTAALTASCIAGMFGAATAGPIFATLLVIAMLVALTPHDQTDRAAVRPALVLAVSVPIAAGLALFGVMLTIADFRLAGLQRSPADTAKGTALYTDIVRTALPGAGEDLYCSRRLATLCGSSTDRGVQANCVKAATLAASRATTSADNPPNAWYNLGMFSAEQNDASKVEVSLRTSSSLAPNWFKPHWALAKLLALTGRRNDARLEAERAFLLDAGKDSEVRRTVEIITQPLH
jgi:O-antigen ligase